MVEHKKGKMKAVQWEGKNFSVSVNHINIPKIQDPLDVIVRLTCAAICGTELHTYHGRIAADVPLTFGHENIGIVDEIGDAITTIKKGDRVIVNAFIDELTDNEEAEFLGIAGAGTAGIFQQFNGGHAQFMRVPFGNANLLLLPPGDDHELDYLLLADVWPSAWSALEFAGQVVGDTVVVFGAGMISLNLSVGFCVNFFLKLNRSCWITLRLLCAEISWSHSSL